MLLGNYFNCLAHASGTCLAARITTGTSQDSTVIVGNRFEGSGLSGLSAIGLGSSTVPSSYDAGNTFEGIVSPVISAGTATLSAVGAAAARRATLGSRAGRGIQIDVTAHTGVGLAQGLDLMAHDTVVCRDTTGLNARTYTPPDLPSGTSWSLVYWNDSGTGSATQTLATNVRSDQASNQFTLAANSIVSFSFVTVWINGNCRHVQVGADVGDHAE
jgi:hypothetical protein